MTDVAAELRAYWDADAATYDDSPGHHPQSSAELAMWAGSLRALLPPPPAKVLDAGAGTGFLSLVLARQGYRVTALEMSPGMLARLRTKAEAAGLPIDAVEGDASAPGRGGFDAVVERHLLWTLPSPRGALDAWRDAAPTGRLVLVESVWGDGAGPIEQLRHRAMQLVRTLRRDAPEHHAAYGDELLAHLPLAAGASPEHLLAMVESSTWGSAQLVRLRDVEWATRRALPSAIERAIGVAPRFAILAGT